MAANVVWFITFELVEGTSGRDFLLASQKVHDEALGNTGFTVKQVRAEIGNRWLKRNSEVPADLQSDCTCIAQVRLRSAEPAPPKVKDAQDLIQHPHPLTRIVRRIRCGKNLSPTQPPDPQVKRTSKSNPLRAITLQRKTSPAFSAPLVPPAITAAPSTSGAWQ